MKLVAALTCLILIVIFTGSAVAQKKSSISKTTTTLTKVFEKSSDELTANDIDEGRDLTKYEDGGFFNCRRFPRRSTTCDEEKIVDFIWKHWSEKRRGYVRVTYDSVDAVSTSHIFIEPDNAGDWMVMWRIARWHAIRQLSNQITNIEKITTVERIDREKDTGKWKLVFKNKIGEILEQLPDR